MDAASHVYVRAWALGCFHSLISIYPNLSEGADGVTKSGRVWRKVPESDARSVQQSVKTVVECEMNSK